MLSRWKPKIRPLAEVPARVMLRMGFSPNGITLLSLGVSVTACGMVAATGRIALFVPVLGAAFLLDAVDGAAARLSGRTTPFGSYLDAMCDRLSEAAAYFALGVAADVWSLSCALAASSMLFSYAKARAAMEIPIRNDAWPDLMERTERLVLLGAVVLLWTWLPNVRFGSLHLLHLGGGAIVLLTFVSLIERMLRARHLILGLNAPTARLQTITRA